MNTTKQKRIKLDNGKTIIVDYQKNDNGKNHFLEATRLLSKIPNLQPCN